MITDSLIEYALKHTTEELPILGKLNRETHLTQVCPQMLAGPSQGTLLRFLAAMLRPNRVLEIGTFTGYSMICLAASLDFDARLHTIEANPELEDIIRRYIWESGMDRQITLHIGQAAEVIPALDERWDLVYIDADKPNYLVYYNMVIDRVRPGGFIIADNTLWDGKVAGDPATFDRDTAAIDEFNKAVQNDPRVDNLLLPFRDGLMIIQVR